MRENGDSPPESSISSLTTSYHFTIMAPRTTLPLELPWLPSMVNDQTVSLEAELNPSGLSLYPFVDSAKSAKQSHKQQQLFTSATSLSRPRLYNVPKSAYSGRVLIIPTSTRETAGTANASLGTRDDFESVLLLSQGGDGPYKFLTNACSGVRTQLTRNPDGSVSKAKFSRIHKPPTVRGKPDQLDTSD
jgi:hypothetical protein